MGGVLHRGGGGARRADEASGAGRGKGAGGWAGSGGTRTRTVLCHPWACTCIESKKRVGGGQEERMRRAARGMGMARGGGGEGGYEYATVLRPPKHRGTAEHLGGHEVVAMYVYPRVGRRGGRGVPLSSKARRIEALRPVRTGGG